MRRLTLALLLVVVANGPYAYAKGEADLVGTYVCRGENPDGKVYAGIVDIIQRGSVLHLRWTLAGDQVAYGIGLRDGKKLLVSYSANGQLGVSVYDVKGLQLKGRWAVAGSETTYPEVLTKVIGTLPMPLPPDHPTVRPIPRVDPSTIKAS